MIFLFTWVVYAIPRSIQDEADKLRYVSVMEQWSTYSKRQIISGSRCDSTAFSMFKELLQSDLTLSGSIDFLLHSISVR